MDKVASNKIKNPIAIDADNLKKIYVQVQINDDMLRYGKVDINAEVRYRIARGIVDEIMNNNLIEIEEDFIPNGKLYRSKVFVYQKSGEK